MLYEVITPYIAKSTDLGHSWTVITEGLPERGTVYTVIEDLHFPVFQVGGYRTKRDRKLIETLNSLRVRHQIGKEQLDFLPSDGPFGQTEVAIPIADGEVPGGTLILLLSPHGPYLPRQVVCEQGRITSYNVCYTKLLRYAG